jgi:hypothetical protein
MSSNVTRTCLRESGLAERIKSPLGADGYGGKFHSYPTLWLSIRSKKIDLELLCYESKNNDEGFADESFV